jgi:hypothetical protein
MADEGEAAEKVSKTYPLDSACKSWLHVGAVIRGLRRPIDCDKLWLDNKGDVRQRRCQRSHLGQGQGWRGYEIELSSRL